MLEAFHQETIYQDFLSTAHTESTVQAALREETKRRIQHHQMMTTPEQVQFLAFLVKHIGASRAIELGVFTGYGSLAIAEALPEEGKLIACDISEEWPSLGQPFWKKAGIEDKIDLQIRPAIETLQLLLDEGRAGCFDFIFIDADKIHYSDYFELSLTLLNTEGLIVLDNVLWIGEQRVVEKKTPATRAICTLLERLEGDKRVNITLVPLAKGMLLVSRFIRSVDRV